MSPKQSMPVLRRFLPADRRFCHGKEGPEGLLHQRKEAGAWVRADRGSRSALSLQGIPEERWAV